MPRKDAARKSAEPKVVEPEADRAVRRWWRTALIAAALSTGLFALVGPRGPQLARHAVVVFVLVYGLVWFCNPLQFFRRMSWVALMLVGGVVLVYLLHSRGVFGPQSSAAFVVTNAVWLGVVFTGAAILFAVLEYLQARSLSVDDAVGEALVKPETRLRMKASRRKARGDDLPTFPPPPPFSRVKQIPDQDTLTRIIEHCAAVPGPAEESHTRVRMLRSEPDRVADKLDAALARVDALAQAGDAEAGAAAQAAREQCDLEPLQGFLNAEADRRGYKTCEDATAYVSICREIAAVADLRGDLDEARKQFEEIIRLVPEDTDAISRMGRVCLLQDRLVEAQAAYQKLLVLSAEDQWRAMAFTNMGTVHHLRGDMAEAERVFDRALEIDERTGDVKGMAANYANLGSICRERGNLGKAERMFNAALEIDENLELAQPHSR
jgi:Tfp pilus assembly protein PilF